MTTEIEFFNDIFEEFVCSEDSIHDNEIWKSNSIIKLIKASDETKNKDILEEGLRIILNLCKNRERGYLQDSYQSESYSVNDLMEQDKTLLNSILKAEFI
ncbi:MAG: hypothetical protein KGD65_06915 [Candidatus Lokiarchaeota archaeon]|nr:hypothetical protein [Candidatus Lokiarchaeota archaeon]